MSEPKLDPTKPHPWQPWDGMGELCAVCGGDPTQNIHRAPASSEQPRRTVWLVELFHHGKSEGYWRAPVKEDGGWRTDNAWAAKQYTESEAKAVAAALDYFPSPNRWSHWVATEHIFEGVDTHIRAASEQPSAALDTLKLASAHFRRWREMESSEIESFANSVRAEAARAVGPATVTVELTLKVFQDTPGETYTTEVPLVGGPVKVRDGVHLKILRASVAPAADLQLELAMQRVAIVGLLNKLPYIKQQRDTEEGQIRFVARDDVITAIHNYAKESRAALAASVKGKGE